MGSAIFNKPIIIVATPRSGSSFLFELLSRSKDILTIGGESHQIIERIPKFNLNNGFIDSNEILASDLDPESQKLLQRRFAEAVEANCCSLGISAKLSNKRFLEKTPKNALRIGMLNKLFPDAVYIFLYRNPRENISSMIDAWRSGKFVTYSKLPGKIQPWSLLLPKYWEQHINKSVEEIAAFQWNSASCSILESLEEIPTNRQIAISYSQLIGDTHETIKQISQFCQVTMEGINIEQDKQILSEHTLSSPRDNKWHRNAVQIKRIIPSIAKTVEEIRRRFSTIPDSDFEVDIPNELLRATQKRNSPCYCQSGKRYKNCHGSLQRRP